VGFKIPVQHPDVVRGRYRLGDIGKAGPNRIRSGILASPPLALGPLSEVWTPILALEEVRMSVEIPFKDTDKFRTLAEASRAGNRENGRPRASSL